MNKSVVLKFPDIKINKKGHKIREDAEIWYDNGFSWEASVVAATIYMRIDKMERRIRRLEGKKIKNSTRRRPKRMRSDVVSLCNKLSKEI